MSYLAHRTLRLNSPRLNPYEQGQFMEFHYNVANDYPVDGYSFADEWNKTDFAGVGGFVGYDTPASSPESVQSLDTPPSTPFYDGGNASPLPPRRASRKGPDHIPRPRNAFLIFRSELCASGKISKKVEGDHRHISIAAAEVWKAFTEDEKQPYLVKAELEKLEHRRLYPSYRFTPTVRAKKPLKRKVNRNGEKDVERSRNLAKLLLEGKQGHSLEEAVRDLDDGKSTEFIASRPSPPRAPSPVRHSPVVRGWVPQTGMPETVAIPDLMPPQVAPPFPNCYIPDKVRAPLAPQQYAPNYSRSLPYGFDQDYTEKPCFSVPSHHVLVELYENVVDRPFP